MTNPQRPLRESSGNPILAIREKGFMTIVTTYCFHPRLRRKVSTRYYIPGCSNGVLKYVTKLCSQGWREYWVGGTCHVIHEEDHFSFGWLTN